MQFLNQPTKFNSTNQWENFPQKAGWQSCYCWSGIQPPSKGKKQTQWSVSLFYPTDCTDSDLLVYCLQSGWPNHKKSFINWL